MTPFPNPKYAEKLKKMETLLLEQMRKNDAPYRFSNQPKDGLKPIKKKPRDKRKKKNRVGPKAS